MHYETTIVLAPARRGLPLSGRSAADHPSVPAGAPGGGCAACGPAVAALQGLLCAPQGQPAHSHTRRTALPQQLPVEHVLSSWNANLWHVGHVSMMFSPQNVL